MKNILFLAIISFSLIQCKSEEKPVVQAASSQLTHPASGKTNHPNHKATSSIKRDVGKPTINQLVTGDLTWTTFDDIAARDMKSNKKKFLVDVYTDWCGWCKVMDKKTFTDPEVIEYLEENFHVVKFNAESRSPVTFKGRKYEWQSGGRNGINQLAIELLGKRMSYPTMVYLDEDMNKIKSIPGFKKPLELLAELKSINQI